MVTEEAVRAAAHFLEYFERAKQIHLKQTGSPLKMYQPTAPDRLADVFEGLFSSALRGQDFVADVLHEIIWNQTLGNANHRTTILFVQSFLDREAVPLPHYMADADADMRFQGQINKFSIRSHENIDRQNEWGYGPKEFKNRHRWLCQQWLGEVLGSQSCVSMTVGPQRLMDFSS